MSRETILARIGAQLDKSSDGAARRMAAGKRLRKKTAGTVPKRATCTGHKALRLFGKMARQASARVVRIDDYAELPATVSAYLRRNNLPAVIRIGADRRLATLSTRRQSMLDLLTGPSDGLDRTAVSHASSAAAETGTLILESGPDNPTTLNFLPEHHIVVLHADDIRGSYEEVWKLIRKTSKRKGMPRTINMITGPSRSADIEQTLLLGAHGPLGLFVIIVGGD